MMEGSLNLINLLRGEKDHRGLMTAELIMSISTIRIHVMDLPLSVGTLKATTPWDQIKCAILPSVSVIRLSACLINNLNQDLHLTGMPRLQLERERLTYQHKKVYDLSATNLLMIALMHYFLAREHARIMTSLSLLH